MRVKIINSLFAKKTIKPSIHGKKYYQIFDNYQILNGYFGNI